MSTTVLHKLARNWAAATMLLCFVGFAAPACKSCDAFAWNGLVVRVFDEQTGENICGVLVTATDGDYREVLLDTPSSNECSYSGASERAGTYRIVVSKKGYVTKTLEGVVVPTEDQCGHVEPQVIDVTLTTE